jgi:hypothetical protein
MAADVNTRLVPVVGVSFLSNHTCARSGTSTVTLAGAAVAGGIAGTTLFVIPPAGTTVLALGAGMTMGA